MRAHRCRACGALSYPAHAACRRCRGRDHEELEVGEGVLLTHTELRVPPPGAPSPLRLGIAEFEGGVRALGQLLEPAEVGDRVVAEWGPTRTVEGRTVEAWRFRPAHALRRRTRKG